MANIPSSTDKFSAGAQALGYIFQARFALLQILQSPESIKVLLEKDDDIDLINDSGSKTLSSLKHKAQGGTLTNLSTDLWRSMRIWLVRYNRDKRRLSNLSFYLFTTETVSEKSFLQYLLSSSSRNKSTIDSLLDQITNALSLTQSSFINDVGVELNLLNEEERKDFLSRIVIFDNSPRIEDIPAIIKNKHMRSIRVEHRQSVFERLEGWWNDAVITMLTNERDEPISGYEVSDKLCSLADEYKSDNLPITFRNKMPVDEIDVENDPRLFVRQLREIEISSARVQNAIIDYYRAFEQRSAWARENLITSDEMEMFEDRLVDEWGRFKDVALDELDDDVSEAALLNAGKKLYRWAEMNSIDNRSLQIRERVSEPYVVRGGFHILANRPNPRVYWHPQFLDRIGTLLGGIQ